MVPPRSRFGVTDNKMFQGSEMRLAVSPNSEFLISRTRFDAPLLFGRGIWFRGIPVVVTVMSLTMWAASASAELKPSAIPKPNDTVEEIVDWFDETTTLVEINLDPVLRQIICRVGFRPFSVGALKKAFGISEDKIWTAVSKLRNWGMVSVTDQYGHTIVGAANRDAAAKMQKWADQMCLDDTECEIAH